MFMLAGVLLYFWMGDRSDALWLSTFWLFMVLLSLYQAWRSDRAVKALLSFLHPWVRLDSPNTDAEEWVRAESVREGARIRLDEGERVPLDARVLSSRRLEIDESVHTGESASVSKFEGDSLRAGSLVIRGSAIASVTRVWAESEWQGLRQVVEQARRPPSYLSAQILKWTPRFSALALLLAVLVAVKGDSWLLGVAVGLAFLPNELPAILTLFNSLTAFKMARSRVLVRDLTSVEELGRISLIAIDKTGTLTQHKLEWKVSEPRFPLSQRDLRESLWFSGVCDPGRDPLDLELHSRLKGDGYVQCEVLRDYPMEREDRVVSFATRFPRESAQEDDLRYFCKGAPEDVLRRCGIVHGVESERAAELAAQGLRVIAVARGLAVSPSPIPVDSLRGVKWEFVGWVGFEDPLRPEASEFVLKLKRMGISISLLTGDHPETARAVAQALGFDGRDQVLSRITPLEKQDWVQKWISQSHRVGMTGDGVNDAPALRSAHVGIAMAREGTDVAREAASVLLLEDDLFDLGQALEWSRGLTHQLHGVLVFLLAAHLPPVVFTLLPMVREVGAPSWLGPAQIAFLHLAIEPVAALSFPLVRTEEKAPEGFQWKKALLWGGVLAAVELALVVWVPEFHQAGRLEVLTLLLSGTVSLLAILSPQCGIRFWVTVSAVIGVWWLFLVWPLGRELLGGRFHAPSSWLVTALAPMGLAGGILVRVALKWFTERGGRVQKNQKRDATGSEMESEASWSDV
jgi:Ca2+-transporting ATPase